MTSNKLDFLSRECKTNKHHECVSRWHGLDLEIYCYCNCHNRKEDVLVDVRRREIDPINEMQPPVSVVRGEISD